MIHDGAGEGILGVGVDVHFNDTVGKGLADFFERGAAAAVEDEVHECFVAVLTGDGGLAIFEDGRLEFHCAGLVAAVHVSKGGGKHKTAEGAECLIDGEHVFRGGVELVIGDTAGVVAVLFSTDDAGFHLQDDVEPGALFHEGHGLVDVVLQAEFGAVKHVAVKEVTLTRCPTRCGGGDEGLQELLNVLRMTVIGVESDENVVTLSETMSGFCKDDGTESHVFDGSAGCELATTGADLDDAVTLRLSEGFERSVDRWE